MAVVVHGELVLGAGRARGEKRFHGTRVGDAELCGASVHAAGKATRSHVTPSLTLHAVAAVDSACRMTRSRLARTVARELRNLNGHDAFIAGEIAHDARLPANGAL